MRFGIMLAFMALVAVFAIGCVDAATQKKIDTANQEMLEAAAKVTALVRAIGTLNADVKSGKIDDLTFKEVKARLEGALTDATKESTEAVKAYQDARTSGQEGGSSGWAIAGAVLVNLVLRLTGIPGFASGSGGNAATLLKNLAKPKKT